MQQSSGSRNDTQQPSRRCPTPQPSSDAGNNRCFHIHKKPSKKNFKRMEYRFLCLFLCKTKTSAMSSEKPVLHLPTQLIRNVEINSKNSLINRVNDVSRETPEKLGQKILVLSGENMEQSSCINSQECEIRC